MFRYYFHKFKNSIVTLRFSLLSIFILLFVATIVSLLTIFYFQLSKVVEHAALLLMEKSSYAVLQELDFELSPEKTASELSALLIQDHILDPNNENEMVGYTMRLLETLPLAQGLHWGDSYGNFFYAKKEADGRITSEVINRRTNPPSAFYILRDQNNHELKRVPARVSFDPRTRPWYQLAINKKKTIWTDVLLYAHTPAFLGTTVATPVFQNGTPLGAMGIDIRLDYLSRFIRNEKFSDNGEVFIVDNFGKVIAAYELLNPESPLYHKNSLVDVHALATPWHGLAFDIHQRTGQSVFTFKHQNITYFAMFKAIPVLSDKQWFIGAIVPANDFTHVIYRLAMTTILIFFLIFVIGVVIMLHLVTRIVTPIKKLVRETEKVKNFHLEGTPKVYTRIKEVIELSDAIDSMKIGLRSFQRYVPATLVRQLIKAGEDVQVSGSKRELAIFFSDIKDFTQISEKSQTNELVKQLCDYLEVFSRIIIKNKGTIDKYIGDSIMSFWGAPLAVPDPCQHAAYAALQCMHKLRKLNALWREENRPAFYTRIGIHYGDTIVGNLGSTERLTYTALGDNVNIASRLVGANKIYGTSILVSETFYKQIKDTYVLRLVDQVMLKGKAETTRIYELLAYSKQSVVFDIDAYDRIFNEAFLAYQQTRWKEAIDLFNLCLKLYPQDTLSFVFIKRCRKFIKKPPAEDWDGVWHISEK